MEAQDFPAGPLRQTVHQVLGVFAEHDLHIGLALAGLRDGRPNRLGDLDDPRTDKGIEGWRKSESNRTDARGRRTDQQSGYPVARGVPAHEGRDDGPDGRIVGLPLADHRDGSDRVLRRRHNAGR